MFLGPMGDEWVSIGRVAGLEGLDLLDLGQIPRVVFPNSMNIISPLHTIGHQMSYFRGFPESRAVSCLSTSKKVCFVLVWRLRGEAPKVGTPG